MINNRFLYISAGLILIVFIFVFFGFFICWDKILFGYQNLTLKSFFEIRLIEIVQLLVTILVAILVSYIISSITSFQIKKKDLLVELASQFQNTLNDLVEISYDYIENPNKEKEGSVKRMFRNTGILLSIFKDIGQKNNAFIDSDGNFTKLFMNLKISITDSPFGEKNPKYSQKVIDEIRLIHSLMLTKLYDYKLKLYS